MGTRNCYFKDVEERKLLAVAARFGLRVSAYIRSRVLAALDRDLELAKQQQTKLMLQEDVEAWRAGEAAREEASGTLAAHAQRAAARKEFVGVSD